MSDIFLSYNREDSDTARRFAEGLEREGFSVWWDQTLRSGEAYDEVTEAALKSAKAVVVLWSPRSVVSRWVRAEATIADRNKTLVPVMIEPCERPIMFELTQTAELGHWTGDASDKAWLGFLDDLRRFVGQPPPSLPSNVETADPRTEATTGGIPTIAVATIFDHTAGKDQAGFTEGLTEELRAELSRFSGLSLLRNVATASYMLSGSVRSSGTRRRVSIDLHRRSDEMQLWSSKFDGDGDDDFALQEQVARAAAARADGHVLQLEIARALKLPEADKSPYDLYLSSMSVGLFWDHQSQLETIRLAELALELNPNFALAHTMACSAHCIIFQSGWSDHPEETQSLGLEHGRLSLLLGEHDARVIGRVAVTLIPLGGDLAQMALVVDRALGNEPANAFLLMASGWVKAARGHDIEAALDLLHRAEQYGTDDPSLFITLLGIAACHFQLRDFDRAARWASESAARRPNYAFALSFLAAAHAHAGRIDDARVTFARVPPETPHEITIGMLRNPKAQQLIREGLRLAGANV